MSDESAAEQAYRLIKRKIISREYAPGQFMHELSICTELALGRTPVHQALHRLKLERLVSIIPRKGIMVDPVSPADIFTVLEVRELIEPYCAQQAARRVTPEIVAQLQGILSAAREAIHEQDEVAFMEADQKFHETVMRTAGNDLIIDFLHSLHGRVARIWRAPAWSAADYETTHREHKRVVDAISAGDKEGAASAMRAHIASLRERVLKQFFLPTDDEDAPKPLSGVGAGETAGGRS